MVIGISIHGKPLVRLGVVFSCREAIAWKNGLGRGAVTREFRLNANCATRARRATRAANLLRAPSAARQSVPRLVRAVRRRLSCTLIGQITSSKVQAVICQYTCGCAQTARQRPGVATGRRRKSRFLSGNWQNLPHRMPGIAALGQARARAQTEAECAERNTGKNVGEMKKP